MGIKWKKILKVVAIVAVVLTVAWVAAPYLGTFGAAIQSGMTAVGEAIASGFAAAGEALGLTTATQPAVAATTTAEVMGSGAAAGEAAGAFTGSALGTEAAAAATVPTAASGAAEGMAANLAAEGAAANTAQAAVGTASSATPVGEITAMGVGSAPGEAAGSFVGSMGGTAAPVTQTAAQGALGQVSAWVKDNPLVASTLLKGAGAALDTSNPAEDKMRAEMEYEQWKADRLNSAISGAPDPYKRDVKQQVLRRADGTLVFTNTGGVPNGALAKQMPGYGG